MLEVVAGSGIELRDPTGLPAAEVLDWANVNAWLHRPEYEAEVVARTEECAVFHEGRIVRLARVQMGAPVEAELDQGTDTDEDKDREGDDQLTQVVSKAVGIDLGTTNSAVAVMNPTDSDIVIHQDPNTKSYTTPSCVWRGPGSAETVVGRRAFSAREPARTDQLDQAADGDPGRGRPRRRAAEPAAGLRADPGGDEAADRDGRRGLRRRRRAGGSWTARW